MSEANTAGVPAENIAPVEDAAASSPASEQPNSSPEVGTSEPASADDAQAGSPAPEALPADDGPAPLLAPPTEQPPLPGPAAFTGNGAPQPSAAPAKSERRGVYVDADGVKHPCKILAKRRDGSVDIAIPATVGEIRFDAVTRHEGEGDVRTGGYLIP